MNKHKIAIAADSGSDVPIEIIEKYQVWTAPLQVVYQGKEYLDGVDISNEEVYEKLKSGEEIPSTSLPSGETVKALYEKIKAEGYEKVIAIAISSGLSGTSNIFRLMAEEVEGLEVAVIDTKSIGIGSGMFAGYVGELIEKGLPFETIIEKAEAVVHDSKVYFNIPTLKYLEVGGRVGRVTSLLGSMMNLNIIISCDEHGIYYTAAKARGKKRSLAKLKEMIIQQAQSFNKYSIGVAYGGREAREEAENFLEELRESLGNIHHSYFGQVSPALGVHTGPGLIGATIQKKDF